MPEIVGIQFKNSGRIYYFSPLNFKFNAQEYAVVETVRGLELGKVLVPNKVVDESEVEFELKPVIRKASKYDLEQDEKHKKLAPAAFEIFKKCVSQLGLPMKPLYCEYTIDGQKIIFYYSADDRVDFRELLKLLTPNFKLRIELRQIGPREAARIVGGIGTCGRIVCCKSCLNNFDFVTMKMAKEQGMSLNTNKISGICGKLMCCISFEHEMYQELKKELPAVGTLVKTPKLACGKVVGVDYLKKVLEVSDGDGNVIKYKADECTPMVVSDPKKIDAGVEKIVTSNSEAGKQSNDSNPDKTKQNDKKPGKQKIERVKPNKFKEQNSSDVAPTTEKKKKPYKSHYKKPEKKKKNVKEQGSN